MWGKDREFGIDMYTLLYLKQITSWVLHIAQETLLKVMWQLDAEGVWERMDTCVSIPKSLCCALEIHNIVKWLHVNIKLKVKQTKKKRPLFIDLTIKEIPKSHPEAPRIHQI